MEENKEIEEEEEEEEEEVEVEVEILEDEEEESGFSFTIKFKLISIISLILIIALGGMISLATFFFKADNEATVTSNNLQLADVISGKAKADFTVIVEKLNLMGTTMTQKFKSKKQKALFTNLFFSNDKNILYVAVLKKDGAKSLKKIKSITNKKVIKDNDIRIKDINSITRRNSGEFRRSFFNEAVVHNVSNEFNMPVVAISIPFQKNIKNQTTSIILSYVRLNRILESFKKTSHTTTFLVNNKGDIIAHPDSKLILSKANFLSLPIVEKMMKSQINNGQITYKDKDSINFYGAFKKLGFSGMGVIATVPEEKIFASVYQIRKRNIIITIIILNLAILIVYFFSKTITTPLVRLLSATKEIEQGNFIVDITSKSGDEIGQLTRSFVKMGKGLDEREKMKDAFGKFVNKELAEQALKGELKLGGERVEAAVFFSDIRSFTAISEKLEPEEVVEFLNQYLTRMVKCVDDTKGVVDKFIGDAVMAVWGAPVSYGNDTENAVNGALMMRTQLIEFNLDRGSEKKPIIKIGSGINTGPVLAGQIGSDTKLEYTVIGDTVNLASRVEALNKPFGTDILISENSLEKVKGIYKVEAMQKITVKGKTDPIQIYAVLGRRDDPSSPNTLQEVRDLVGIEMKGKPKEGAGSGGEVKYEIIE